MFQLLPNKWYAVQIFSASGAPTNPHTSPIFLHAIEPLKTGQGLLKIEFFHANYPEGVQSKEYVLRVIHRASTHLAGIKMDDEQSLMVIFSMEKEWMEIHFPKFDCSNGPDAALDRVFKISRRG
jgi:hypothetical protein